MHSIYRQCYIKEYQVYVNIFFVFSIDMNASDVMKDVVDQINNVTSGNETNNELETVPPNRFSFLLKTPCIYNKCSSDMYIVFWIGIIMLLMGIFGNVYTLVKICRSKLYKSTTYACILMLVISNIVVLFLHPFRFSVFINAHLYHKPSQPGLIALLFGGNMTYIPVFWSAMNTVYFAYERFFLIRYPHLYFVHHTSRKIVIRSVATLLIAIALWSTLLTGVHFLFRESIEISIASLVAAIRSVNLLTVLILLPLFHKSKTQHLQDEETGQHYQELARSMTIRIVIILIVFIVSQIPDYAYLWVRFYDTLNRTKYSSRMVTIITGFYQINFSISPYIYFIIQAKFTCKAF